MVTATIDEDLLRLSDLLAAGIPSAAQTIQELIAHDAAQRAEQAKADEEAKAAEQTDADASADAEPAELSVPSRPQPGDLGEHPEKWWDSHAEGTHGRPRPGTRVHIRGRDGAVLQAGIVLYYEGIWPHQHSFPVRWDYGVYESLSTTHDGMPLGWDYEDPITRAVAQARRERLFSEFVS